MRRRPLKARFGPADVKAIGCCQSGAALAPRGRGRGSGHGRAAHGPGGGRARRCAGRGAGRGGCRARGLVPRRRCAPAPGGAGAPRALGRGGRGRARLGRLQANGWTGTQRRQGKAAAAGLDKTKRKVGINNQAGAAAGRDSALVEGCHGGEGLRGSRRGARA
ncbi:MAG: hypothetical protein J3K34DRAFT_85747 [Monoraphidium minutum]|nr:MAG: hypothetical protein J3K34DRAFT_85747 [Monoraphidium minutum]